MPKSVGLQIPIAIKLVAITTFMILAAVVPITYRSTQEFTSKIMDRERDQNLKKAEMLANMIGDLFKSLSDKTVLVGGLLLKQATQKDEKAKEELGRIFETDADLISVEVITREKNETPIRFVKEEFLKEHGKDASYIDNLRKYQKVNNRFDFESVFSGEREIRNATTKEAIPLISIGLPLVGDGNGQFTHIVVAEVRLDRLQKVFTEPGAEEGSFFSYLVDKEGQLLAHPKEDWVIKGSSMRDIEVVSRAIDSPVAKGEVTNFKDPFFEQDYTGAFARTPDGLIVVTQVSKDVILEPSRVVTREAIHIAGQIISVALFLIFVFSMSLTSPIERLAEMAQKVAKGDFNVKSNVKSFDEVGSLGRAFDNMVTGLQEREKMKNVLDKFHGSAVADDLIKGQLELGGQKKFVTVFFSDLRDFTKFSEGHSPEEVVQMLNEYFKVMVGIVNKYGGVVDKFIGDAIMAVWGVPNGSDQDPFNAVRAGLEMRRALEGLNKIRTDRGQSPIRFGAGVHTGFAISGNIGSDERMEYTVIGDTVNTAARIEASTKAFGTDLLISGETKDLIGDKYVVEVAGEVEVKGKSEPLRLYKVRGYVEADGAVTNIRTEWSDYEAGHDAKVKISDSESAEKEAS